MEGIGWRSRKGIALRQRNGDNLLRCVKRSKDREVAINRRLLNAGNPVNASLLAIRVDVINQGLNVREVRSSGNRSPVRVKRGHPSRVDIDVLEAMLLKPRGCQRIRLRLNVGLRKKTAVDGLLAEGAPAKIGFLSYAVHLCLCTWMRKEKSGRG